ncbi:unnamed protein product [Paramecium primaurelia]|uniref:Uncharacterized protein n=1 Tax=Paramecium primaurelia TaxID=5886 RepID=A0A8S1QLU4_PARPR|nr:unnamed protein product [Paramecium primaurelia]
MRSQSINRRKQIEQQQLGEENQRIRIKLLEIANEKKTSTQQVKLCQAKKKLQQLLRHQQNMMENLILMKKITNVTSSITHRVQVQDFQISKLKQLQRYLQDDEKSFHKPSINQSPNISQSNSYNTQHTKTLDAANIKLQEFRMYSNGQLLQ